MPILDIKNRIFIRGCDSQVQVKLDRAFGAAGEQVKAQRICPHFINDIVDRHQITGAFTQLDFFAVTHQLHQIVHQNG